jgi:type I restriction-modification system DNA methylase subunit
MSDVDIWTNDKDELRRAFLISHTEYHQAIITNPPFSQAGWGGLLARSGFQHHLDASMSSKNRPPAYGRNDRESVE